MKWFYALNDQQQGPVDDDTLLSMLQAGTINHETLIWREGMGEWLPYAQVADAPKPGAPEAAVGESVAAASANKCAECGNTFPEGDLITVQGSPVCAGCKPLAVQRLQEGTQRSGELGPFTVGGVINQAFELAKLHWLFVVAILIVGGLISQVAQLPFALAGMIQNDLRPVLQVIFYILGIIVSSFIQLGQQRVVLDIVDDGQAEFGRLFSQGKILVNYVLASIVFFLIIFAGFLLLIIPGIIWSIKYSQYMFFIIDRQMKPMEALHASAEATKGVKGDLFLVFVALTGIQFIGALALCIGLFFTMPMMMIGLAVAYRILSQRVPDTRPQAV